MVNADFFRRHGKRAISVRMGIYPTAFFDNFIANISFKATNMVLHADSVKRKDKNKTESEKITN